MKALREYLEENGIPHSIYTDKFGVYYSEREKTDFKKVMEKLLTRCIDANSAQAKGRVEIGNRTQNTTRSLSKGNEVKAYIGIYRWGRKIP
ncbi:MAG: hypothetical protein O6940_14080 [Ignavibacteria bacterium]|nr:hypothetical protein [Ignavibacteria bacterium]